MRLIRFVLTAAALLALPLVVFGQPARPEGWETPLTLGFGWWQHLSTDIQGNVHVTWYGIPVSGEAGDTLNYRQRRWDGTWTPEQDVIYTGQGGYTVRNQTAVTSDGMLHAVIRSRTVHAFASAAVAAATSASSWSVPVQISSDGYYVSMTADRADRLHVVYSGYGVNINTEISQNSLEADPCPFCYDLYYRRSLDGGRTWESPVAVSLEEDSGSDRVDVKETASGRLLIYWDEGLDWYVGRGQPRDVRFTYSDDGGVIWSPPVILTGGSDPTLRPIQLALTELRDRSLLAVWRYAQNDLSIYYQVSQDDGETWTQPAAIPGITARDANSTILDDYELITDYTGTAHLFATGYADQVNLSLPPALYHLRYSQGEWLPPLRVFYDPTMRPEWPKAKIGLQNDIHLSWFVRAGRRAGMRSGEQGTLLVMYSHLSGGSFAARPTQEFRPTLTPLPTATVVQNLIPTATPFPTIQAIDRPFTVASRDTYAAQTLLGGMGAVGLLCIGVYLLARRLRQR